MTYSTDTLPDVSNHSKAHTGHHLNWVGMEKIGLPIELILSDGSPVTTHAMIDIFVSLDSEVKGIHMSRLYASLNERLANNPVTFESLNALLTRVLDSHEGISESAMIRLAFDLPLQRKALLSDNSGFQLYSIVINQKLRNERSEASLEITIPYSSTCPCSASLANQLNAEKLSRHFTGDTVDKAELLQWLRDENTALATPHNQRSYAYIKMLLSQGEWDKLDYWITQIEEAIGTPVQTAVKREDEQEFARLNGSNLMFCEDAARRIKGLLESLNHVCDYHFKVEHQESLHAHNAVVIDQKKGRPSPFLHWSTNNNFEPVR